MCRFGIHKWGKWEDVDVEILSEFTAKYLYTAKGQRRYCQRCGKKKVKY